MAAERPKRTLEEQGVPSSMRAIFKKATSSRAAAMKAMCYACTGYDRGAVKDCSAVDCPLWEWRPGYSGRQ